VRFLIAVAATLACLPLLAAETAPVKEETVTWYDVELVVFRNLDTRSAESWPADAGIPDVPEARPLFPPADTGGAEPAEATAIADGAYPGTPTPYVPLDASAYQLTGLVDSLRRSSKYEPILHVAWTQPPLGREQSPYLRITLPGTLEPAVPDEETLPVDEEPLLGRTDDTLENRSFSDLPLATPDFLAEEEKAPELVRPLDGVVQLSVSRYLHIDLDLLYLPDDINLDVLGGAPAATRQWVQEKEFARERRRQAILEALARGDITLMEAEILNLEPEQDVFQGFRLDQYRRLRSGDIHYFDHPVFGAIVKVTPREVSARLLETQAPRTE